jgi:hypothetical protein
MLMWRRCGLPWLRRWSGRLEEDAREIDTGAIFKRRRHLRARGSARWLARRRSTRVRAAAGGSCVWVNVSCGLVAGEMRVSPVRTIGRQPAGWGLQPAADDRLVEHEGQGADCPWAEGGASDGVGEVVPPEADDRDGDGAGGQAAAGTSRRVSPRASGRGGRARSIVSIEASAAIEVTWPLG